MSRLPLLGAGGGGEAAVVYDEDAVAWWGASAGLISNDRKQLDSDLFVALKAATLFSTKFDYFYIFAHEVEAVALRNMIKNAHHCTKTGLTWTQDRGYEGGGTDHLDTNYAPASQGVNYQRNSACYGVYMRTFPIEDSSIMGAQIAIPATWRASMVRGSDESITHTINHTSFISVAATDPGLYAANRSASNARQFYYDGSSINTGTNASVALQAGNIYLMTINLGGTPGIDGTTGQMSAAFAGGSLSAGEHSTIYTLLNTYLGNIGA